MTDIWHGRRGDVPAIDTDFAVLGAGKTPERTERRLIDLRNPVIARAAHISGILALILFLAAPAFAQFTRVTGTVVDPTGLAYSYGTISAQIVPGSGASPTLNGVSFTGLSSPVAMDINGKFTMQLADNNVVLPSGSQWKFIVNFSPGIPAPMGTGPQSFSVTVTIIGASQDISVNLNAAAPAVRISTQAGLQTFSNTSLGVQSGPTNGGFTIGSKPSFDQVWYNTPINFGKTTSFAGGVNYSGGPGESLFGLELLVNPTSATLAYQKEALFATIMDADPNPAFSGGVNFAKTAIVAKCIISGTADSPGALTTGNCGPAFNPVCQIDAGGDGACVNLEIDVADNNTYTGSGIGVGVNKHVDDAQPNKVKTGIWFNLLSGHIPMSWMIDSQINPGLSLNGISLRGVARSTDAVCTDAGGQCGIALEISSGSTIGSRNNANNSTLTLARKDTGDILHLGEGTSGTIVNSLAIVAKTGAYTLTANDGIVQASVNGGSFTLTIPHALKQEWRITRTDASGNTLTLTCDSGAINNVVCGTGITLAASTTDVCYADGAAVWCK